MDVVAQPLSPLSLQRRILKEGTFNARDAGGYPLEQGGFLPSGKLYRSDALNALTPNDRAEFERLDIRTVIDLRDAREANGAPDMIDESRVCYIRIPIFEDKLFERDLTNFPPLLGQYQIIMDQHPHQLIKVLKLMSETAAAPILVHCTAGKDRTGLIIALIHSLVGVAQPTVLADYAASEQLLNGEFEEKVRDLYRQITLPPGILGESPRHAPPSYLKKTLEMIETKYGSIVHFLKKNGLQEQEHARLIAHLTSPHSKSEKG